MLHWDACRRMHSSVCTTCIYMQSMHASECINACRWKTTWKFINPDAQRAALATSTADPFQIVPAADVQIAPRSSSGLYLARRCVRVSSDAGRLRSASACQLIVPRKSKKTLGDGVFPYSGLISWNNLSTLETIAETIAKECETRENEIRSLDHCLIIICLIAILIARVWETVNCQETLENCPILMCCLLSHSYLIRDTIQTLLTVALKWNPTLKYESILHWRIDGLWFNQNISLTRISV